MGFFSKLSRKSFESSIRSDEKIIELSQKLYDDTGNPKYLKRIQKCKDGIERTKKLIRKYDK